ncbi:MAG: WbqC family protein [Pontimonas sp.]
MGLADRRIAILQSNYIPWRGYFDIINLCDIFVFLDDVQYTRRDWRNRNKIRTSSGPRWLTVPVLTKGAYHQMVQDTRISDPSWAASHWRSIELSYRRAPHFKAYEARYRSLYERAAGLSHLSAINRLFIQAIMVDLRISTELLDSAALAVDATKSNRILEICRRLGATRYLSGPSAAAYLDLDAFAAAGIAVEWMRYDTQISYSQVHGPPYTANVSALDMLFNVGEDARDLLVGADCHFTPDHASGTPGTSQ